MTIALAAIPEKHLLDGGGDPCGGGGGDHRAVYGAVALIVKADDVGLLAGPGRLPPRAPWVGGIVHGDARFLWLLMKL